MISFVFMSSMGEITLPPRKTELRYIGSPFLHRSCRAEIPVKDILSNLADLALVGMILFLWTFSEQCKLVHDSLDTLVIHLKPAVHKLMVYPSYTISFSVLVENDGDFRR